MTIVCQLLVITNHNFCKSTQLINLKPCVFYCKVKYKAEWLWEQLWSQKGQSDIFAVLTSSDSHLTHL